MTTTNFMGVPVPDPNRRFTLWHYNEIYHGAGKGPGQNVPNVDDLIVDYARGMMHRVTKIDYSSFEYDKVPWTGLSEDNEQAGIGGHGTKSTDFYKIYIDDSKHPSILRVDSRLDFKGADNVCIKIFVGTDITVSGEVISCYFKNGIKQGDTIPLALASVAGNVTVKSPLSGSSNRSVDDNELVTIVVYTVDGVVSCIARAYVILTNSVVAVEAPTRTILDIKLKSPFISDYSATLLELPINLPLDDLPLELEIVYNDGKRTIPVDGTRAKLAGLRNSGAHDNFFISTILGQELPLSLSYTVGANESYNGDDLIAGVITRDYKATTLNVDGAYSVKLFAVPTWIDVNTGWRIRYFLYSLERGSVFEATAFIRPAVNTPAFDPKLYGVKQYITVTVQLDSVSPTYNTHIHVQTLNVTLMTEGDASSTPYLIEYMPGSPVLGADLAARFDYDNVQFWRMNLGNNLGSLTEFLDKVYRPCYPLYDSRNEDKAPDPTHMEIIVGSRTYARTIEQWNDTWNIDFRVNESEEVFIRWIYRTPQDDHQLGTSPLLTLLVNNL